MPVDPAKEKEVSVTIELPRYRSEVSALKVAQVVPSPRGYLLGFEDQRFAPHEVSQEWHDEWLPEPGDYLVVIQSGALECWGDHMFEHGGPFSAVQ